MIVEKNIAKILDGLYAENGLSMKRNNDVPLQKKGIDVIMDQDGIETKIDEKSASTYFQGHLRTFAFEIATKNNKDGNGWFDPSNSFIETESYMLVYPYAPNKSRDDLLESVDEIEALLIKKSVIWDYLRSKGIDNVENAIKLLEEKGIFVDKYNKRVNPQDADKKVYEVNGDVRIVKSLHLAECPTNILISRKVLKSLSDKILFKKY